jgi:P27 family predicted phage terminase small subunit
MAVITQKNVKERMENLGVYREEFAPTVARYVTLNKEYYKLYKQYAADGYKCTVVSAGGEKKAPIVTTLESLRKDLLQLEESLGLTPRGLLKLDENAFKKPKNSAKKDRLI